MTTQLEGTQALLLAEACKINTVKKEIEGRLKEIKEELSLSKGSYKNSAGDKLTISETEKFTEINSKKVFDYLKKNKMMASFPGTVKVQLTPLKKVVPESTYNKWRKPLDPISRWIFK